MTLEVLHVIRNDPKATLHSCNYADIHVSHVKACQRAAPFFANRGLRNLNDAISSLVIPNR